MVTPLPQSYVQIAYGTESNYSNEAMEEIDRSSARWGFHPRYTVYRIADAAKRLMTYGAAPVIQKKVHGAGEWVSITTGIEIWYGAGYAILTTPLNNDDTVQCLSGKYLVPSLLIGCLEGPFSKERKQNEITCKGDSAVRRSGGIADWKSSLVALYCKECAEISSSGGAANSHVRIIHEFGGVAGNGATIDFQDTDAAALSVSVTDDDIVVVLDTDLGAPVSTALQVCAALNNNAAFKALKMRAEIPSGEDGSGVVADSGPYTLAGGRDQIDFDALQDEVVVFQFFSVPLTGDMTVGFGKIESVDWQGGPSDELKAGLSVVGAQYPMRHVIT